VKRACDAESEANAFELRALCTDSSLPWAYKRAKRFAGRLAIGFGRSVREALVPSAKPSQTTKSSLLAPEL